MPDQRPARSGVPAEHYPQIVELDLNPLRVGAGSTVAVDVAVRAL